MVLGHDLESIFALLEAGSKVELSQTADRDTEEVVRIHAHLRPATAMPKIVRVTAPVSSGDFTVTVDINSQPSAPQYTYTATVPTDTSTTIAHELVDAINAGGIDVVAEQVGDYGSNHGYLAITQTDPQDEVDVYVTSNMVVHDTEWKFSFLIDGAERASQILVPGRARDRVDFAANLASLTPGDHTLAFRLSLESGTTGPIPVELPAVYIDPVIFETP